MRPTTTWARPCSSWPPPRCSPTGSASSTCGGASGEVCWGGPRQGFTVWVRLQARTCWRLYMWGRFRWGVLGLRRVGASLTCGPLQVKCAGVASCADASRGPRRCRPPQLGAESSAKADALATCWPQCSQAASRAGPAAPGCGAVGRLPVHVVPGLPPSSRSPAPSSCRRQGGDVRGGQARLCDRCHHGGQGGGHDRVVQHHAVRCFIFTGYVSYNTIRCSALFLPACPPSCSPPNTTRCAAISG